jgi:hypothetical protein
MRLDEFEAAVRGMAIAPLFIATLRALADTLPPEQAARLLARIVELTRQP